MDARVHMHMYGFLYIYIYMHICRVTGSQPAKMLSESLKQRYLLAGNGGLQNHFVLVFFIHATASVFFMGLESYVPFYLRCMSNRVVGCTNHPFYVTYYRSAQLAISQVHPASWIRPGVLALENLH